MSIQGCTMGVSHNVSTRSSVTQPLSESIEMHAAWKGNISESHAEHLLKNQPPYTYLLRQGEVKESYGISFVEESGSIHHQSFTCKGDEKKWFYENCATCGRGTDIEFLVALIMDCGSSKYTPVH